MEENVSPTQEKKTGVMIDISTKQVTKRVARAKSTIQMSLKAFKALIGSGSPKGNVFETAKIAGIMAAKSASNIIPMCHPLMLNKVTLAFRIEKSKRQV